MSEQARETAPVVAADVNGRTAWAALMLAADADAMQALIAGLSVPRRRLKRNALEALREPLEGPDVTLDDELELRLRVALPEGDEESAPSHSWRPVDLLAAEADPPSPPTISASSTPAGGTS